MEYATWAEFVSDPIPSSATIARYTTKLAFDITGKGTSRIVILPSTTFEGSTYVTHHTALNDRHLVRGTCEAHTWASVDLIKDGKVIFQVQQAVQLNCLPKRVAMSTSKEVGNKIVAPCLPVRSGLLPKFTSATTARGDVCLPQEELYLTPTQTASGNSTYNSVEVPLQASFSRLSAATINVMSQTEGVRCEVDTKWITKRSFKITEANRGMPVVCEVKQQLVSTQGSEVRFPPLAFPDGNPNTNYTGAMSTLGTLHLVLPASATCPSVHTSLLDVQYSLELNFTFRLGAGKQAILLRGKSSVDCKLAC